MPLGAAGRFDTNDFMNQRDSLAQSFVLSGLVRDQGHNMSVLGSQVDVDMDESVPDPVPKHQGHTGTGCYKLHDHEFLKHRHRPPRKGGTGEDEGPGRPNGGDGLGAPANGGGGQHNNTNLIDLPVDMPGGQQPNPVQLNSQYHQQLKTKSPPAQRTPGVPQNQQYSEEIPLQVKSSS